MGLRVLKSLILALQLLIFMSIFLSLRLIVISQGYLYLGSTLVLVLQLFCQGVTGHCLGETCEI